MVCVPGQAIAACHRAVLCTTELFSFKLDVSMELGELDLTTALTLSSTIQWPDALALQSLNADTWSLHFAQGVTCYILPVMVTSSSRNHCTSIDMLGLRRRYTQ